MPTAITDDLDRWLHDLSVTDAPLTRQGLATALDFFRVRMPSLDRAMQLAFLEGMDLHRPVSQLLLAPGEVIAAFRKGTESPFHLFYTKAGTSVHALGVNPSARGFRRFRVRRAVTVLESRCASARDTWTEPDHHYIASGGGLQLIVPDAANVLEVTQ